ncbi:hypothetical protein DFH11DRAFT_454057 [Phellopilus nigrolimitatus]|nr:hypothetical protein DFH11DRAFT_454057 [Phellopilus nigrolimitatus]
MQIDGPMSEALRHFCAALKGNPKNTLATIWLAQVQVKNGRILASIHTLDSLMQPPNPRRSLEATVMRASLGAYPRPDVSSADATIEPLSSDKRPAAFSSTFRKHSISLARLALTETLRARTPKHTHTARQSRILATMLSCSPKSLACGRTKISHEDDESDIGDEWVAQHEDTMKEKEIEKVKRKFAECNEKLRRKARSQNPSLS